MKFPKIAAFLGMKSDAQPLTAEMMATAETALAELQEKAAANDAATARAATAEAALATAQDQLKEATGKLTTAEAKVKEQAGQLETLEKFKKEQAQQDGKKTDELNHGGAGASDPFEWDPEAKEAIAHARKVQASLPKESEE